MSDNSPADENLIDETSYEDASPSSAEDTGAEPESMLDAVADSIDLEFEADSDLDVEKELAASQAENEEGPDPQETGSDQDTDADQKDDSQKASDEDDELSDEPDQAELDSYKPKTKRRIEKLLSERNELRQERANYAPFVEAMTNHDLAQEDVALLLGAGAALRRGDYEAFLAGVQPYVEQAQMMVGQRLSPDLEQQVNQGYITADHARELAQRRAYDQHYQVESERYRVQQQEQQLRAHASNVQQTISDWEANIRNRDPDYSQKQDAVRRYAQAIIQERGLPQTVEQAVEYAEAAYREVNELTKSVSPQRRPTRPTPNGALSSNAHGAKGQPNSLMEAALQGLASSSGS